MEGFYLGGVVDPATGDRTDDLIDYDPGDLTTHGVIVGMTGSGKTGLGIIYLEEALLRGIPTLILDPKGDMTNLLLTFPDLLPADFEPWVDEGKARKEDKTVAELAEETAELWRKGLGWWDQDGSRIAALEQAAGFRIYTPGSTAGVPLSTTVYSSNRGRCPGSCQPAGDCIRAMLSASSPLFTRPTYSSMRFGLLPAASTIAGASMWIGMGFSPFR